MRQLDRRLTFRQLLLLGAVALTICMTPPVVAELPSDQPRTEQPGGKAKDEVNTGDRARSDNAAGMRIYVDPTTGQIGTPPPGTISGARAAQGGGAAGGLTEVPSPADGGGVMVDLQGRFRSTIKAAREPDGSVSTGCTVSGAPASTR